LATVAQTTAGVPKRFRLRDDHLAVADRSLVVAGLLLGLGSVGMLIGLALLAFILDRTAPKKLDELIDFLTFTDEHGPATGRRLSPG